MGAVRRPRALIVALVFACVAVAASPVDASTARHHRVPRLTGRVVDQAGRPIGGATVVLASTINPLVLILRGFACGASFGTDPSICSPWALSTHTDRTGAFAFALDPKWLVGEPGSIDSLTVTGHPQGAGLAGANTNENVTIPGRDRSVGTVVLWQPAIGVTRSNGQYAVHVPPAPSAAPKTAQLLDAKGGVTWSFALDNQGNATVDERVFENGAPIIAVSANTATHVHYTAWQQRVADVGVPTSRGLACSTYRKNGQLGPITQCPYTNGQLGQPMDLSTAMRVLPSDACEWSSDCANPNTIVLDLGSVRILGAIVWRGCTSRCVAETSLDGQVWSAWPRQTQAGDQDAVVTGPQIPVRYVRVTGDVFMFWNLRQLSVWTDPIPVVGAL